MIRRAALCVVLGVFPQPVLETARPDLETVSSIAGRARYRAVHQSPDLATAEARQ